MVGSARGPGTSNAIEIWVLPVWDTSLEEVCLKLNEPDFRFGE